jgi:hypothetical protein
MFFSVPFVVCWCPRERVQISNAATHSRRKYRSFVRVVPVHADSRAVVQELLIRKMPESQETPEYDSSAELVDEAHKYQDGAPRLG